MELSRRGFMKLRGATLAASSIGALGFGAAGEALAASVRPFKLTRRDRDAEHLHLLRGRLRHPDLQHGRPREERQGQHHPHRGRSGPSGEPRHALPEGRGAARRGACADAGEVPDGPRARHATSSSASPGMTRSTASPG